MKIFTLTLLFLSAILLSNPLTAQCPSGNVTLTTQAEVDQFAADYPDCETIEEWLTINGADITDISGLDNLKEIKGTLFIFNNSNLKVAKFDNLYATDFITINDNSVLEQVLLPKINTVEAIKINRNTELTDIEALNLNKVNYIIAEDNPKLKIINFKNTTSTGRPGGIIIKNNNTLKEVNFYGLTAIGLRVGSIKNNSLLEKIDLPNLTSAAQLTIRNNPNLKTLNLDKLKNVTRQFYITDTYLKSLSLPDLESTGSDIDDKPFKISDNPQLLSITLERLKSIGTLYVSDNTSLNSINLSNLEYIGGFNRSFFGIFENPNLSSLNLSKLISMGSQINQSFSISGTKLKTLELKNLKTCSSEKASFNIVNNSELEKIIAANFETNPNSIMNCNFKLDNNPKLKDIDFSKVKHLKSLIINKTAITNLYKLQPIEIKAQRASETGDLTITNNPNLTDCSGLCNVLNNNGVTGTITIENNPSECNSQSEVEASCIADKCPTGGITLTSQAEVDQFAVDYPNCETIEEWLTINGADITDISGLSNIKEIKTGSLTISNTNVKKIDFKNLSFIGSDLIVVSNAVLDEIDFSSLTTIDFGDIKFNNNPNLIDISLNNLSSQIIALNIKENASLTTLSICLLPSTDLGEFNISKNASLTTLCFDNLTEVGAIFKIDKNNQLNIVNTFQNLKSIGFDMDISDNANLSSIDFNSLNEVNGSLSIKRNPKLTSILFDQLSSVDIGIDFTDNTSLLSLDLSNLKSPSIGGMIDVSRNSVLNSLKLCSYSSADYIHLNQNTSLSELCFDNLTTIDGMLEINESNIEDLDAFKILVNVGDIHINNNAKLQNVSFNQLTTVENDIFISANNLLKSLNFCNVTSVGSILSLNNNTSLESICFDELKQVSLSLIISSSNLSNLDTFQGLIAVGFDLNISNNSNLTDCSGLCNILNNNGISGTITIANNPSECSNQTEVEASCTSLAVEEVEGDILTVYPNPTKGTINLSSSFNNVRFTLSDIMGRILKKGILKTNTLDISSLKNGVYYLSILKDNNTLVKTIIKR